MAHEDKHKDEHGDNDKHIGGRVGRVRQVDILDIAEREKGVNARQGTAHQMHWISADRHARQCDGTVILATKHCDRDMFRSFSRKRGRISNGALEQSLQ